MTESEDEEPQAKVGRKHNAGVRGVGIKLPPLNAAFVEVHRELARVSLGAKDMAVKNKNVWKTVKITHYQLNKAQERITQLENNATTMQHPPGTTSHDAKVTTLREEVAAQAAIAAKAKKAMQLAETEINRLRSNSTSRQTESGHPSKRTQGGKDDSGQARCRNSSTWPNKGREGQASRRSVERQAQLEPDRLNKPKPASKTDR